MSGFSLSGHVLLDFLRKSLLIEDMVVSQQRNEQEQGENDQEYSGAFDHLVIDFEVSEEQNGRSEHHACQTNSCEAVEGSHADQKSNDHESRGQLLLHHVAQGFDTVWSFIKVHLKWHHSN